MWSPAKYKNKHEPIFEPWFRWLRFGVFEVMRKDNLLKQNTHIFDFGCGPSAPFFSYLLDNDYQYDYVGFDPLYDETNKKRGLSIKSSLSEVKNDHFDIITMFAVLEHLNYPDFDFSPIINKLHKGGYLFLTTPTPYSKPVLEFLSYRLGLVSRREIEEHKHYYSLREIVDLFSKKYGLLYIRGSRFELLMNQYAIFKKA